jgi:hypothetical protein
MSFKTAQDAFESALQVSEATENSLMEFLLTGLIELTRATKADMSTVKSKLETIEHNIRQIR